MPAIFRRTDKQEREDPSRTVVSLIANLDANVDPHPAASRHEFRAYIRDRDRSQDEAWMPIRSAARNNGGR